VRSSGTRGTFDELVAGASPALRPVCRSLRRLIAALHRDRTEIIWPRQRIVSFGIGPRKMSDHYCYIAVYPTHVNLGFYHGATLKDRAGLLVGTGMRLRHIRFRDTAASKRPAVAALLREAIADRRRNARPANLARRATE
jgi:Domain of unknown function (DU1801)